MLILSDFMIGSELCRVLDTDARTTSYYDLNQVYSSDMEVLGIDKQNKRKVPVARGDKEFQLHIFDCHIFYHQGKLGVFTDKGLFACNITDNLSMNYICYAERKNGSPVVIPLLAEEFIKSSVLILVFDGNTERVVISDDNVVIDRDIGGLQQLEPINIKYSDDLNIGSCVKKAILLGK